MSWHYLPELVEDCSEAVLSAGEQSAPLRSASTAGEFCCSDSETECSNDSHFGMTCEPLTDAHGVESWISSLAVSRAKTSVRLARATDSMENEAGSGPKWPGSLAKFDQNTHSWRTAQQSLFGGLEEFSEIWPKWGSMRNGECFRRAPRVRHTHEKGCFVHSTLTVVSCEHPGRQRVKPHQQSCISAELAVRDNWRIGGQYSPSHAAWFMGMPDLWTSFGPMETCKFQSWLDAHGAC